MKTVWDNVEHFESLVANYAGSKYAVAVDSCTNALFLSMQAFRYMNPDDNTKHINLPSRTYLSVPMQVKHSGYHVEFTDLSWSGVYELDPLPIVDSAQRFTKNMYRNGYRGTLYCLSFHSKKILSIGRGGMILTDSLQYRDWLRAARYDGRSSIYYNDLNSTGVDNLGWHMYMTPEEAVRGIEQFYKTTEHNPDSGRDSDYAVDLSTIQCLC